MQILCHRKDRKVGKEIKMLGRGLGSCVGEYTPLTRCHDKVFVCVFKLFWVGIECVCNVWVSWEKFSPKVIQLWAFKQMVCHCFF